MDRLILETTSQCEWFTLIDYKITKSKKSKTELIAAYQSQLEIYALALHQLEPKSLGRIRAVLVSISPGGVQEVEVALANLSQTEKLAQEAALIVGGQSGAPRPGEYCRYCPVRVPCLAPT
jgi:CRISPR/Cas system-associated exonuclease Cas4 (RecB family)